MYRSMTDSDLDTVLKAASVLPGDWQGLTLGLFCSLYGRPSTGQWAELFQVLAFDSRYRLCSAAGRFAAA